MTDTILVGPPDNMVLPYQSLGITYYNEIKKKNPNKTILIDNGSGEEITYGELLKLSLKLALELKKLGVKKGDVITIVSQNNWKCLLTTISGFYIGAVINPLNPEYTPGELKHFLAICRPVLIFCTTRTVDNVLKLKDEDFYPEKIVIFDGEESDGVTSFNGLLEGWVDLDIAPIELDPKEDGALILTSSGTTGLPKCVLLTHAGLRITMTYARDPVFLDLNEKESTLAYLPFFHVFGSAISLASVLHGAKLVILEKFVPNIFLELIENHKITKLFAVPPILLFLVKSPLVENYDITSITDVICGAAVVTKDLEVMVRKRLNVNSVRQVYGMTELTGAVTMIPKNVQKFGSLGQVTTTHQIKVCKVETGQALPPNQVGELRIKGGGLMKGYLGNDEETADVIDEDGFLKSGDLGYYDEEGFFFIVDRLKEIIKYKGFQVSPAELENLLIQHAAVKDAGVIGIPHERAGEVPIAFIVKQPDKEVTEEELVRYIEENVSVHKRLYGGVKFLEEIPKNAGGKVLRRKLKQLL